MKSLKLIRFISASVDYFVLFLSLIMLLLGLYAFWDSHQVYEAAQSDEYSQYKPLSEESYSFAELKRMNRDVIGWITVYGTGIDYPLLQGVDNGTYINTTVKKRFSTAGSIFLDYRNRDDFSDFNSIIYGHHMERSLMFGDIDKFVSGRFFETHKYGVLFADRVKPGEKKRKGIDFFAILKTRGNDSMIFTPAIEGRRERVELLDYIYDNALRSRPMSIKPEDHVVLLDTCTFTVTNGRYILCGKLTDKVHKNPFPKKDETLYSQFIGSIKNIPVYIWILLIVFILGIIYWICERNRKNRRYEQQQSEK